MVEHADKCSQRERERERETAQCSRPQRTQSGSNHPRTHSTKLEHFVRPYSKRHPTQHVQHNVVKPLPTPQLRAVHSNLIKTSIFHLIDLTYLYVFFLCCRSEGVRLATAEIIFRILFVYGVSLPGSFFSGTTTTTHQMPHRIRDGSRDLMPVLTQSGVCMCMCVVHSQQQRQRRRQRRHQLVGKLLIAYSCGSHSSKLNIE